MVSRLARPIAWEVDVCTLSEKNDVYMYLVFIDVSMYATLLLDKKDAK